MGWLKKKSKQPELYCNEQQCGRQITTSYLAYDLGSGEIFCPGDCSIKANAKICMRKNSYGSVHVEYISRERAIKLLGWGFLKQSNLEDKLEE